MTKGATNGSLGLATQSGWMNSELFPLVLEHFIRHMNISVANPGILVMDNHKSHIVRAAIRTGSNVLAQCAKTTD